MVDGAVHGFDAVLVPIYRAIAANYIARYYTMLLLTLVLNATNYADRL